MANRLSVGNLGWAARCRPREQRSPSPNDAQLRSCLQTCESASSPSSSAARRPSAEGVERGQGSARQAACRLISRARTGNDLEEVPDAADGGLAQDDLEEDAGATDDEREDHDREVLQHDA
jgi:hypothetical protein